MFMLGNLSTLALSVCCPLLETLEVTEVLEVENQLFIRAWKPFIKSLSKCHHLKLLVLSEWQRPLDGLEVLKQLEELEIYMNTEADNYDQQWQNWINTAIKALPKLKKASFSPMNEQSMEALAGMPNLECLTVTTLDEHDQTIATLPKLKALQRLQVNNDWILECPEVACIPALSSIEYIVHDIDIEFHSSLVCIPTLIRFEVDVWVATFDWFRFCHFLRNNPQLESIKLKSNSKKSMKHVDSETIFILLKKLQNLQEFSLDFKSLSDAPFKSAYLAHVSDRGQIRDRQGLLMTLAELNDSNQPKGRGVKRSLESNNSKSNSSKERGR